MADNNSKTMRVFIERVWRLDDTDSQDADTQTGKESRTGIDIAMRIRVLDDNADPKNLLLCLPFSNLQSARKPFLAALKDLGCDPQILEQLDSS